MTNLDLTRLRELAEKATPGPWDAKCQPFQNIVLSLANYKMPYLIGMIDDIPNAAFIAAANPQTVLALIDALETARRDRDKCRAKCGELEEESDWLAKQIGPCNKEDTEDCPYPFPHYVTEACCIGCWRREARNAVEAGNA